MREILFRGKRTDNGQWAECFYVKAKNHWHPHGIHKDWMIESSSANGGWFAVNRRCAVDPATVGQYTGQKDRNGKRIFEGDILKIAWYAPRRETVYEIHEVVYSKSGFFTKRNGKLCGQVSNYISPNVNMRCEVIGNIHDNPELLKGGISE